MKERISMLFQEKGKQLTEEEQQTYDAGLEMSLSPFIEGSSGVQQELFFIFKEKLQVFRDMANYKIPTISGATVQIRKCSKCTKSDVNV